MVLIVAGAVLAALVAVVTLALCRAAADADRRMMDELERDANG